MLDLGRTIVVRQHGCQVEGIGSRVPPPSHPASTPVTQTQCAQRWTDSDREE